MAVAGERGAMRRAFVIVDSVFGIHTGNCVEYEPNEYAR